ncbi:MAG: metallophosphoesterase family protein [Ottowia sp.]
MIRVALFADIHGKFLLPFKMVDHWQRQSGCKVDLIVQCGDMGAFADRTRLDKATLRHARTDADELGFLRQFTTPQPQIALFLQQLGLHMLCVRGNHEDHAFLDALEAPAARAGQCDFAIDCYGRIRVLRTGQLWEMQKAPTGHKETDRLSLVGIGRIGDTKGRSAPPYIQDYERQSLRQLARKARRAHFDALITHDQPLSAQDGQGSADVAWLLNELPFDWHFHGHTGQPFSQTTHANGITQSVKIKELEFGPDGQLPPGCMALLEKEGPVADGSSRLHTAPPDFLNGFTRHNWHWL